MSELLPCPFHCGSTPVVSEYEWTTPVTPMTWYAGCPSCRAYKEGMSREEAIAAWNCRSPQPSKAEERSAVLEEVMSALQAADFSWEDGDPLDLIRQVVSALKAQPSVPEGGA